MAGPSFDSDGVPAAAFPPHDPDFPDVDPATGDERMTEPNPEPEL